MMILGIEAAARSCSAAVYEDGKILSEIRSNAGMTHSETLLPMVDEALKLAEKTIDQVDAIALTKGPGSFTGLRIGAATAKGLALGIQKPLIPVGTLEALTFVEGLGSFIRVGIMDARRSQVYTAAYRCSENGETEEILAPEAMPAADLLAKLQETEGQVVFFGDAVTLYRNLFQEGLGERYSEAPAVIRELNAATVCMLADKMIQKDPSCMIPSDELELDYLRKPQAVREREAGHLQTFA